MDIDGCMQKIITMNKIYYDTIMKRLLFTFIMPMVALMTMAQLNMQNNDKTIAKSNYVFLKEGINGFRVDVKDYRSANLVTIELGQTAQQAQLSLQHLQQWYNEHKVDESVLVNQSDGQLTIYKASPTLLLVSKSSEETCRATYQSVIKTLLIDELFAVGLTEKSDIIGILTSTDVNMLNRKIKKIN